MLDNQGNGATGEDGRTGRKLTRRALIGGGLSLLAVPLLQACAATTPTPAPTPTSAPQPAAPTATTAAKPAATATTAAKPTTAPTAAATPTAQPTPVAKATAPAKIGGTVGVLATWGGDEQDSFLAMVKPFEDRTGIKVQYTGTRDLNAVLTTRVQGGNPPDTAGLPGPGQMADLAKAGKLVDLSTVLDMTAMRAQYADDWLKLGQVEGKQVGVFIKSAMKGLVWYNVKEFQKAGYQIPKTWTEMMALSKKIADSGTTPWSIGLESGAASGWPATDWLENIVIRQSGPEVYDKWYRGEIKWSSPEIKKAWETWGEIVADPKMVYGGKQGILATPFSEAANPLFMSPPKAYLHHQASFITDFIVKANPGLKPVADFNFFPFPDIESRFAGAVEGAGDLFGMFKDTPQARALMQWLVTPDAQAIWVKRGGALSPNKQVSPNDYPDEISKQMAQSLTAAKIVRFDASDLMPEAMNNAFWKATLDYVSDPSKLESVLAGLDKTQADAYKS